MRAGYERFRARAVAEPDRIALETGAEQWSMKRLLERCDARYDWMVRHRIGSDSWVACSLSDGIEAVLTFLAASRLGTGVLFLPPDISREEWHKITERLPLQGRISPEGYIPLEGSAAEGLARNEVIFPTGGTSGSGRLVRILYQSVMDCAAICHSYEDEQPDGRKLSAIPPWHVVGMLELLRALLLGKRTVLPGSWDVEGVLSCCRAGTITNLVIPSTMLAQLLYHKAFQWADFRHLRILRYCLEPLPTETLVQTQALFPGIRLYSDYSITEAVGTISVLGPEEHRLTSGHYLPTSGEFLPGVEAKVVDGQGNEVALGSVGELTIHTPWQFIGYLGEQPAGYWISTGDMGWADETGRFNLSGFRSAGVLEQGGNFYVLPAAARRKYLNAPALPFCQTEMSGQLAWQEQYQRTLMMLHSSLDMEEVKQTYLGTVQSVIQADAYGLELFPLDAAKQEQAVRGGKWYQDAIRKELHQSILLHPAGQQGEGGAALSLAHLKYRFGQPVDVLYVPLYTRAAYLHGVLSFVRSSAQGFSSWEMTLVKQLSHHLNLALMNAQMYQELESRQILVQQMLDSSQIGTLLSSRSGTVYYMNSVFEELLDREEPSPVRMSAILDRLHDNVREIRRTDAMAYVSDLTCYLKPDRQPVHMRMRTVKLAAQSDFLATFLSSDLEQTQVSFGNLDHVLTAREREVLLRLCHGLSYKEIAQSMCISINTVNFHVKQIYRKMEVGSRSELVNRVLYLGSNGICYLPWMGGAGGRTDSTDGGRRRES